MTTRAFKIDADYNLVRSAGRLVRAADGEAIAQAIRIALSIFQGEWFLDTTRGLPYYQEILVKNPNVAQIRRVIADRILSVPGVLDLVSLTLDFDRAARTLSVSFKVTTDLDELKPLEDTVALGTP